MKRTGTTHLTCGSVCLLIGLFTDGAAFSQSTPQQLLDQAAGQYNAALDSTDRDVRLEKFRRAELLFARLAQGDPADPATGIRNADICVNLGNAALGAERLGPAILAYRRALYLDPDHHRARQNLAHARTLLPDWVPRPEEGGLLDTFFAWSGRLPRAEFQTRAALAFLIAAAMIAASIRWRQPVLRYLAVVPAVAWLLLLSSIAFLNSSQPVATAVVVVPEVVARSADSVGAPPRFPQPLPSGTEVDVAETRSAWTRVRLFDGCDAWLPISAFELVGAPDWVVTTASQLGLDSAMRQRGRPKKTND